MDSCSGTLDSYMCAPSSGTCEVATVGCDAVSGTACITNTLAGTCDGSGTCDPTCTDQCGAV